MGLQSMKDHIFHMLGKIDMELHLKTVRYDHISGTGGDAERASGNGDGGDEGGSSTVATGCSRMILIDKPCVLKLWDTCDPALDGRGIEINDSFWAKIETELD